MSSIKIFLSKYKYYLLSFILPVSFEISHIQRGLATYIFPKFPCQQVTMQFELSIKN